MIDENDQSKSTRERVLQTLLAHKRCTINELADAVEINPISVRHHITRLQADGLVDSAEERHGVGRPRRIYYLTEQGLERFPTRYLRLTMRLLEQLKETLPPALVNNLFTQIAADLASDYEADGLTLEERLNLVTEVLANEGFHVDWERSGDHYMIREINCPYFHIGQNHPEVCSVDQTIISTVLSTPAEKVKCMLQGDNVCAYIVMDPVTVEKKEA